MKILFPMTVLMLFLIACKKDNGTVSPEPDNSIPVIRMDAIYDVLIEENVKYAEGLSHEESFNSSNATTIPLNLDIYTPDNELENRPVFMFIHGGGFSGGSKQQEQIVDIANYYSSRGWVFISIDYRLKGDFGTVPQEWLDFAMANVPSEDIAQTLAVYPAQRDAKAALRWLVANAETYKINTDFITVGGGSAGAITAITLGISEQEDYRDEINSTQDPTLMSTNLEQTYQIQTIVDFWGSKVGLDALEQIYGRQRFDSNDPSLLIVHGTEDPTVLFSSAEDLKAIYEANEIPLVYYPIEGAGHGAWNATVDNKRIEKLAFDFIVEQQGLIVE